MANKTYLFMISHPAHYHMFKHTIRNLQDAGNRVISVIRPKDVLEQLCINDGFEYLKVKDRPKQWGMLGLGWGVVSRIFEICKIVRKERPKMLIGSDGVLAYAGKFCGVPSFEFFEDDVDIIGLYATIYFPLYTGVVCPDVIRIGKWAKKCISYAGYQKLAYLHPNWFAPDKTVVVKYFSENEKYFIVRLSGLNAHHDVGIKGFDNEQLQRLIDLLKPYGKVCITSERPLEPQFEPYRMKINPMDMHHLMAHAVMCIVDGQSMAVESSILGTPSVRYSSFAGKLSVLEELEHKYHLTVGVPTGEIEQLFTEIQNILDMPNRERIYAERKDKMLSDKIDVTEFWTNFIENYTKQ